MNLRSKSKTKTKTEMVLSCTLAQCAHLPTCTLAQCTRLSLNCFHPISTTSRSYANGHFRSSIKGNWTFKSSQIPKSKLRLSHFHPFNNKFEGFFCPLQFHPLSSCDLGYAMPATQSLSLSGFPTFNSRH